GEEMKLTVLESTSNGYPVDKIMEVVQENYAQLGIDVQIDKVEPATARKRWLEAHDFDLFASTRILVGGFNDYFYCHSKYTTWNSAQGRNFGSWTNPEADRLLDLIVREPDLEKQKALLWQFQDIIADDLPALWFGFPRDLILAQKDIQGFQPNAMWQYWNTWSLWRQ